MQPHARADSAHATDSRRTRLGRDARHVKRACLRVQPFGPSQADLHATCRWRGVGGGGDVDHVDGQLAWGRHCEQPPCGAARDRLCPGIARESQRLQPNRRLRGGGAGGERHGSVLKQQGEAGMRRGGEQAGLQPRGRHERTAAPAGLTPLGCHGAKREASRFETVRWRLQESTYSYLTTSRNMIEIFGGDSRWWITLCGRQVSQNILQR